MIRSMTGFGEARLEQDGQLYHLELRSVNHRYFKTALRLPEEYGFLEAELEQLLRRRLARGSISVRLYIRDLSASAAQDLNLAAIRHYVAQLRAIEPVAGQTIDLAVLAALPGVCQPHELTTQERQQVSRVVRRLADEALTHLVQMREVEGRALAEDLRQHCGVVRAALERIRQRAPAVVREYRDRLLARVQELIAGSSVRLAEPDILKEVAVYADRSDISEELSRMASHLDQFETCMAGPEPSGRKLEFIAQELLREANTAGSKAGDAQIAQSIIEIKSAIDRIKEQVQNVE